MVILYCKSIKLVNIKNLLKLKSRVCMPICFQYVEGRTWKQTEDNTFYLALIKRWTSTFELQHLQSCHSYKEPASSSFKCRNFKTYITIRPKKNKTCITKHLNSTVIVQSGAILGPKYHLAKPN